MLPTTGLEIRGNGDLVDTKTGKVLNDFGATRFDVAVRALRGQLDPAAWEEVSQTAKAMPWVVNDKSTSAAEQLLTLTAAAILRYQASCFWQLCGGLNGSIVTCSGTRSWRFNAPPGRGVRSALTCGPSSGFPGQPEELIWTHCACMQCRTPSAILGCY